MPSSREFTSSRTKNYCERSVKMDPINRAIQKGVTTLMRNQHHDGHWIYEMDDHVGFAIADYIFVTKFIDEVPNQELNKKFISYLKEQALEEGGWSLYPGGEFNLNNSTNVYFALKILGVDANQDFMKAACAAIRAKGGAEASSILAKIPQILHGVIPWSYFPAMPVEIMLLPKWFPFNIYKLSYWSRATVIPLLCLRAVQASTGIQNNPIIDELFLDKRKASKLPDRKEHQSKLWWWFFRMADALLRPIEKLIPKMFKDKAISVALEWIDAHRNGDEGIAGVAPPIHNSLMLYHILGATSPVHLKKRNEFRVAMEKLLVVSGERTFVTLCLSPVWDTGWAAIGLIEAGTPESIQSAKCGLDWLVPRQVLELKGDWAIKRPNLRPGGWPFQYVNSHFPDLDDTAVVAVAMNRFDSIHGTQRYANSVSRAAEWIAGMQGKGGGWGAFEADNTSYYLNSIPFADNEGLLDPPTADITARCLWCLAEVSGTEEHSAVITKAIQYLSKTQEVDGSWWGRWGVNYVYGTWSVLKALNAAGVKKDSPMIQKAIKFLLETQNTDGGWGEGCNSYEFRVRKFAPARSTPCQTSWALLGLMDAGQVAHCSVSHGINFLQNTQRDDDVWHDKNCTGTGHPNLLFLNYPGYSKYFPIWALARYRNLISKFKVQI